MRSDASLPDENRRSVASPESTVIAECLPGEGERNRDFRHDSSKNHKIFSSFLRECLRYD